MTVYIVNYIRNPHTRYWANDSETFAKREDAEAFAYYRSGTIVEREKPEPSGSNK